jgi:hypothetical protein
MNRLFVHSAIFDKKWKQARLTDETLRNLQEHLIVRPTAGSVVKGIHGLRKVRWNKENQGKRGGIRVFYADFPEYSTIFLLTLIKKNEREDLCSADYEAINRLIEQIRKELEIRS